jgi:hypothetical protein
MNRFLSVAWLVPLVLTFQLSSRPLAHAQVGYEVAAAETLPAGSENTPLAGSHLLWAKEGFLRDYLARHPEIRRSQDLEKSSAWTFSVGSTATWYADDFTSSSSDPNASRYLVPSTCRAVGTHCYVFVEDQSWISGRVVQAAVDSVVRAFDQSTPANPLQGVYETCLGAFGDPPDVDGDPKIVILILDILDGYAGSGGYVAGYFYSLDQFPKTSFPTSNVAEIYYLDCDPADLSSAPGLRKAMSVTAHEFQHMIHFHYDPQEITFINELCSLTAEIIAGYPVYNQAYYVQETDHYLLDWRGNDNVSVLKDYSRAARFGLYVMEQYGSSVFRPIVASALHGIAGFNAGLVAAGILTRSFQETFADWLIANILDDPTYDPRWGYSYAGLPRAAGTTYGSPSVGATSTAVERLAADYISFVGGTGLTTTFTQVAPSLQIRAVEIGPSGPRVLSVSPGVPFVEPEFGSTYTEVHFVVSNTSQSVAGSYTYSATGSGAEVVELKWDETSARGYLPGSPGDTACVLFDGYPGARLDSVRVSLSRAGIMTGGIWHYTGATRPTPLGSPLAVPFTAAAVVPGWTTVDLRSQGVDVTEPFAIALVNQGDHLVQPRVQVTTHPGTLAYNSYTYLNGTASPDWYYLTQSADSVWIYLVRAYISYPTSVSGNTTEVVPSRVELEQNFPNPFNPTTTIGFTLPRAGYTRLEVFSILGTRVAMLMEGELEAGFHAVEWTPAGEATGVYLLRLQAGAQTLTRRMVLVR